ncbi:MAG: hypothetical protein DME78_02725 [Verrucomicrobia bacterium]|nr:MAG: hypothetical protein DME78_02725 [Verrucomicrobiota bacterium]
MASAWKNIPKAEIANMNLLCRLNGYKVKKLKRFFRNDVTLPRITSQVRLRLITVNAKKFYLPCRLILLRAADMKCAAVSIFVSIAFVSQTFAVLRPLFPAKPAPPFSGESITFGDDSIRSSAEKFLITAPR